MECLAKKPENRPQTVTDILNALDPLDQRFGTGFRIGQRIGATLSRLPVVKKPASEEKAPESEEDLCRLTSWPKNKPIAEIVFPHALPTSQRTLATLWVMLPQVEVEKRLLGSRYNNFICTMSPHPMALWLTVLYNAQYGPRWLPCYLDLKTPAGQEMAFLIGKSGQYKILFFTTENPRRCAHVVPCTVALPQRKLLQEWVMTARTHPSVGSSASSKDILRNELNTNLKAKVLQQLEASY
jgi:hypothetical protein